MLSLMGCAVVDSQRFLAYFHNRQQDAYIDYMRDKYLAIADERVAGEWTLGRITCADNVFDCGFDTLATTNCVDGRVVICDWGWELPTYRARCHEEDLATTILHEVSHIFGVHDDETRDWDEGVLGFLYPGCKQLPGYLAKRNAETIAMYAQCKWSQATYGRRGH